MRNIFPIILILLFFFPLISGEIATLGIFKQFDPINLPQTCDNCTYVNLTRVQFPNASILFIGQNMQKIGTDYNFTFIQTLALGNYIITTCGDPNGVITCANYNFEISVTGTNQSTAQGIFYFILLGISILFLFLILIGAIYMPADKKRNSDGIIIGMNEKKYIKLSLWFLSYLGIIWIDWLCWNISEGFLNVNIGTGMFKTIFWSLISFLPFTFISLIASFFVIAFRDKNIKKLLGRGITTT